MFDSVDETGTGENCDWMPDGFESSIPSELVGVLPVGVDAASLSGDQQVRVLQTHARAVAHHQAVMFETMMSIVDTYQHFASVDNGVDNGVETSGDTIGEAFEAAVAELRAALSLTRRAAESDLNLAWQLRERHPNVLQTMRDGQIDLRRVRVIVDDTTHLDDGHARQVSDQALANADGHTTGQLRAFIRRLCINVDPDDATNRYDTARTGRRVIVEPEDDGTARLIASGLAPDHATGILNRLTRLAKTLPGDDTGSIDQRRVDILTDLLSGDITDHITGQTAGTVDIHVDLTTLARLDNHAADLAGYGPVIADIARQIVHKAHKAEWRVTVTDQDRIVHVGTTSRRPTASDRRIVESRDRTCVFPGCRTPATTCDLDHRIPVADGGTTHPDQLVALCRHDHVTRHKTGWTHTPTPDRGHNWTSPLGIKYHRPRPP